MPEQSHPPYAAGALVIPRQLKRWLDINPQNGPLERTKKTFTLPAFDFKTPVLVVGFPYDGAIVTPCLIGGVFNYTAPNVFSLKTTSYTQIPQGLNYTLVIASKNPNGTLTRYTLSQGTPILPLVVPLYTGQPINKIFRIEVWFTSGAIQEFIEQASLLLTSVLGDQDYQYGVDSGLETMTGSVTDTSTVDSFGLALNANLPMVMPANTYI